MSPTEMQKLSFDKSPITYNPVLCEVKNDDYLTPYREGSEIFLARRDGVSFEVFIDDVSLVPHTRGFLVLTSDRLVFISRKCTEFRHLKVELDTSVIDTQDDHHDCVFMSCGLYLVYIESIKFEQPILGANYLDIKVKQNTEIFLRIYIRFYEGGCGSFLPLFYNTVENALRCKESGKHSSYDKDLSLGLMDASDPTTLYVVQPKEPRFAIENLHRNVE